jgi:hypothetical protein
MPPLRAERHAETDVVGPARDVIAHQAEQADALKKNSLLDSHAR